MKKIIRYSLLTVVALIVSSCSTEDKTVDDVIENVERGAFLRTIAVNNQTFDFNDTSSMWSITVEEQDQENGALLEEVEVYAMLIAADGNSSEELVKTIPASQFSPGPLELPRADIEVAFSEALSALGLQSGDFESTDQFNIRLNLKLTDGRSYTQGDANPNITGGQFFQSPFAYRVQFFCALADASLFSGSYTVTADAWADYAPGDQVPVVEGDDPYTFRILSTNNPFINNTDTSYIEVTINPDDGSVTAMANEVFDYGVPVTVSGSGTVGTCTGDINLILDFVPFATDQLFTLTKN
ncbi:hypothetical protein OOZ15_07595 [Galbibacter sp. EGI 63066]|uniref:hypothetical protein n=1 Tax=Galbibacter sp. EGI 63066 TaxID=2993559 RepID=UPI002248C992|nr:hypothetical protein [Galbibacter sp. EGI 63066]MCX2679796.1 hypothetical protein [Galbibacter sp. EGI 63066]